MTSQVLDTLELEQERGITIKSQTVNLTYQADDGEEYQFNFNLKHIHICMKFPFKIV